MYAIRDSEGKFVGKARSRVTAHRKTRRRNMAGRVDVARLRRIEAGGTPTRWTHVPEHDAWIKKFNFAAVTGWSKTTSHEVAVRHDKGGKPFDPSYPYHVSMYGPTGEGKPFAEGGMGEPYRPTPPHWRADLHGMMGFEALTPTHYKSAAAAKRAVDAIFKVFTAARAKGAEIDIDTLVDNEGQIRWHDTHLGLAGVRREDLNMAGHGESVFVIDGIWRLPDGTLYPYTGFAGQASGGSAYEARRGADGKVHYLVDSKPVAALPKTPTTKALMVEFNKMEHVSRLVSVDASGHIVYPERSHGTLGPWKSSANRAGRTTPRDNHMEASPAATIRMPPFSKGSPELLMPYSGPARWEVVFERPQGDQRFFSVHAFDEEGARVEAEKHQRRGWRLASITRYVPTAGQVSAGEHARLEGARKPPAVTATVDGVDYVLHELSPGSVHVAGPSRGTSRWLGVIKRGGGVSAWRESSRSALEELARRVTFEE